jgi:hypothetical protein
MKFLEFLFGKVHQYKPKEVEEEKVYFHEDLYCQVEVVPRENLLALNSENEKINEFSEAHRSGLGYTDIYARGEHQIKTISRCITLDEFEALLTAFGFRKISNLYSGYGSYEEICKNTFAFKFDFSVVFCDLQDGLIKNIWLDGFRFNKESELKESLVSCLNQIGEKWNLILNDWDLCEAIDLNNISEIERYVNEE